MFLAEYGAWADDFDQVEQFALVRSYIRRKRWEARIYAQEFGNAFTPKKAPPAPTPAPTGKHSEFLSQMGAVIKYGNNAG